MAASRQTDVGDIPSTGWWAVLRRTAKEFRRDNVTDWAAALTYYALLSLFPALIVLVALVGLVGEYPQTTNALLDIVRQVSGGNPSLGGVESAIDGVVRSKGGAGALLGVGLLGALWSASGYVGAFMRASNAMWDVEEGRPAWKLRPLQIVVMLAMILMLAFVLLALVVSGPLAQAIGDQIGLGSAAVTVYQVVKWPVIAAVFLLMLAVLYYAAPNVELPRFRWITPGAVVALVVAVIASVGFGFYVSNFGSYNKTYGTLGGVVTLLVWMWIANIAVLFGQQLNSEVERARELTAGRPAERAIQLPPREAPRKDPDEEAERVSREAVAEGRFERGADD